MVEQEPVAVTQERSSVLAIVGLCGIGINTAALIAAPVLRPDVNPLHDGLSRYAVGPWGTVQSAGFVALGIGSLAIAGSLWLIANGNRWMRIAAVMLGLAAFSLVGLAVFPMGAGGPMTPLGDLHLTAGTMSVGWQCASVAALLPGLRAWPRGERITRLGALLLGLTLLGAASVQVAMWRPDLAIPGGLAMRVILVPLLLWWAIVALDIRRKAGR